LLTSNDSTYSKIIQNFQSKERPQNAKEKIPPRAPNPNFYLCSHFASFGERVRERGTEREEGEGRRERERLCASARNLFFGVVVNLVK
jgi:hypothetical protein